MRLPELVGVTRARALGVVLLAVVGQTDCGRLRRTTFQRSHDAAARAGRDRHAHVLTMVPASQSLWPRRPGSSSLRASPNLPWTSWRVPLSCGILHRTSMVVR